MSEQPIDEQEYMAIVTRVMQDKSRLDIQINIREIWLLISGLQLVTRHPGISEYMKDAITHIAMEFQVVVENKYPETHELLEMGWNTGFDVDGDGNPINESEDE